MDLRVLKRRGKQDESRHHHQQLFGDLTDVLLMGDCELFYDRYAHVPQLVTSLS